MKQIDCVLFDFDGVLCSYDFEARLRRLSALLNVPAQVINQVIFLSGLDEAADEGMIALDDYLRRISAGLGVPVSLQIMAEGRMASTKQDQAMLALAREIQQRVPVALLTNNGPMLAAVIDQVAPGLRPIFGDYLFFSYQLAAAKPEPAAFIDLAERVGVVPERILFIDDDEGYIAGAEEAGVQTHLFRGIEGLRSALTAAGVV